MSAIAVWLIIKGALAVLGGWLGWALGGLDALLSALVVFMAVDYVTGFMCAVLDKKLCSNIGFRGIFRKVMVMVLVGIGHAIDVFIHTGEAVRTMVIVFYLSNEGISILENAVKVGLPIPERLKDILSSIKEGGKKK